jgi:hypothetical protein
LASAKFGTGVFRPRSARNGSRPDSESVDIAPGFCCLLFSLRLVCRSTYFERAGNQFKAEFGTGQDYRDVLYRVCRTLASEAARCSHASNQLAP